jgi:hypothetical protein
VVKHIFRYLKGTIDRGITFCRGEGLKQLKCYCDSDWAGDMVKRRSTSGFVFLLAEGPILWKSSIQRVQAQSSCEAEYIAAAHCAKQAIWLRQLLREIGCDQLKATIIKCDNQGAIRVALNTDGVHERSKHIDLKHHFVRDRVEDGTLILEYVPTELQVADVITKALSRGKFEKGLELLKLDVGTENI